MLSSTRAIQFLERPLGPRASEGLFTTKNEMKRHPTAHDMSLAIGFFECEIAVSCDCLRELDTTVTAATGSTSSRITSSAESCSNGDKQGSRSTRQNEALII